MKRLFFVAAMAAAILLTTGFNTMAQPGQGGMKGMKKGMQVKAHFQQVMKELNLTDKQKEEIKAIRLENQRKMVDLKASLEKIKIDQHEMMSSGKFDKDKYLKSVEQINKIKGDMNYNGAVVKTKIYDLLDENQKKVWLKNADKMMAMKGAIKNGIKKRFMR